MATKKLSKAKFVKLGYGQVEPNHLSARRTGQIYAQLPADENIEVLENGQFVKYDYATGKVNFTGAGEWLLVFNEVKVYDDRETDADFAMKKSDYNARVYSPVGQNSSTLVTYGSYGDEAKYEGSDTAYQMQMPAYSYPQNMPEGTKMVPRCLKTNEMDIMTTNTINEEELSVGDILVVGDDGYLTKTAGTNAGDMKWVVSKVYTMPDNQPGVKIQRIQ